MWAFACMCVCVCVSLVIQHARRMRRLILSSMIAPDQPNLSTLPHERQDFEHKICLPIFSTTIVRKVSHSMKNSARCYYKCLQVLM